MTRLALGRLSDEEVGAFIARLDRRGGVRRARVGDRRADGRDAAPALRALARPARERRGRGVRRAACGSPGPSAELRGPERIRDIVRQRLLAPLRPRRSRRSSSQPSRAAVRAARARRRRRARPARARRAVEEAIRNGLVEELPEPAARLPLHARARAPRRLRPDHAASAAPSSTSASARRSSAPTRPTRRRVLPELAHHFTLAAPVAGVERARRLQPARRRRRARGGRVRRGAPRGSRPRSSSASPTRASAHASRSSSRYLLYRDWAVSRRPRRCSPRASTPPPASRSEASRRARSSSARGRVTGDPAARSREMRDGRRGGDRDVPAARRRRAVSPSRGRHLGRRAPAPGPAGRSRAPRSSARSSRGRLGRPATRRRVVGALAHSSASARRRSREAIRRCEELLGVEHGTTACSSAVLDRFLALLLAMAGRFDDARERSERAASSSTSLPRRHARVDVSLRRPRAPRSSPATDAGAERDLRGEVAAVPRLGEPRRRHAVDAVAPTSSRSSTATTAAGTTPRSCLAYGRDVPRAGCHREPFRLARRGAAGRAPRRARGRADARATRQSSARRPATC